jgi:hypothetical protein
MNNIPFVAYTDCLLIFGVVYLIFFRKIQFSRPLFIFLFCAIPIVFFCLAIFFLTDNIPFKDDYVLLESLYKMQTASSLTEWLQAFFKQVNQHRFGFERIMMLGILKLMGSENIKAQIIIGNAFLLGILYLFFNFFKGLKLHSLYFIPIVFLLFNFTYFENATWGIAAIQNTPILFFALLTVHFLAKNNVRYYLYSLFFAVATMFTSGNGLAIWIVGSILLIFQNNWKWLVIWILVATLFCTFYFTFDYEFISSDKANLWKHPILNGIFVLTFWGNLFYENQLHPFISGFYWDVILCLLAGALIGVWGLFLALKFLKNYGKNLSYDISFLGGAFLFLAFTGLMLVMSRPVDFKVLNGGEVLSRRYMLFGAVFMCIGYLTHLYLWQKNKKIQVISTVVFAIIGTTVNINSYYKSLPDAYALQQELRLDGYYWQHHRMLLSFSEKYGEKFGYNHPTYMIDLVNSIDRGGIYSLTDKMTNSDFKLLEKANSVNAVKLNGTVDTTMLMGATITQGLKERILYRVKVADETNLLYLGLKSDKNVFLVPAIPQKNTFWDMLLQQDYFKNEYFYETWKVKFPSDDYEIWVLEQTPSQLKPLYTNRRIRL